MTDKAVSYPELPPNALQRAFTAFLEDYELRGEDAEGRDGCYMPNETDRYLIEDFVWGLMEDDDWLAAIDAAREQDRARAAAPSLAADVESALTLLESNEWAEHFAKTELGQRLEWAITELHNEIHAAEDAAPQAAVGVSDADIDRIVPALAPIGEDFPAEWALWKDRERIRAELRALCATKPEAPAVEWDGKLPERLQLTLNALRLELDPAVVNGVEHEVRSVFEAMHTSLTTTRRMFGAARDRLEAIDAAQPDPFAAPAEAPANEGVSEALITRMTESAFESTNPSDALSLHKHWYAKGVRQGAALAAPAQGAAVPDAEVLADAERYRWIMSGVLVPTGALCAKTRVKLKNDGSGDTLFEMYAWASQSQINSAIDDALRAARQKGGV